MPIEHWENTDSDTPHLIRTYSAYDSEPPIGTTVRTPDGRERTRRAFGQWWPGPWVWSGGTGLVDVWPGEVVEEIVCSPPPRENAHVLSFQPGDVYHANQGPWRWDGTDWEPLQPGHVVRVKGGGRAVWDGRIYRQITRQPGAATGDDHAACIAVSEWLAFANQLRDLVRSLPAPLPDTVGKLELLARRVQGRMLPDDAVQSLQTELLVISGQVDAIIAALRELPEPAADAHEAPAGRGDAPGVPGA